jgi:hypothetical protein
VSASSGRAAEQTEGAAPSGADSGDQAGTAGGVGESGARASERIARFANRQTLSHRYAGHVATALLDDVSQLMRKDAQPLRGSCVITFVGENDVVAGGVCVSVNGFLEPLRRYSQCTHTSEKSVSNRRSMKLRAAGSSSSPDSERA